MLDATERKTLAWCAFIAGVLCLIPGEQPKGPKPLDFVLQVLGRVFEHRATQGAWALCLLLIAHHLWKSRKEQAAEKALSATPAAATTAISEQSSKAAS